jgi:hypothetical protein
MMNEVTPASSRSPASSSTNIGPPESPLHGLPSSAWARKKSCQSSVISLSATRLVAGSLAPLLSPKPTWVPVSPSSAAPGSTDRGIGSMPGTLWVRRTSAMSFSTSPLGSSVPSQPWWPTWLSTSTKKPSPPRGLEPK